MTRRRTRTTNGSSLSRFMISRFLTSRRESTFIRRINVSVNERNVEGEIALRAIAAFLRECKCKRNARRVDRGRLVSLQIHFFFFFRPPLAPLVNFRTLPFRTRPKSHCPVSKKIRRNHLSLISIRREKYTWSRLAPESYF